MALSADLVRGKRSHASALQTSCRLPARVTISARSEIRVSYASADIRRDADSTNVSARPSGSAREISRGHTFAPPGRPKTRIAPPRGAAQRPQPQAWGHTFASVGDPPTQRAKGANAGC